MTTAVVIPTFGRIDEVVRCVRSVTTLVPAPHLVVLVDGNADAVRLPLDLPRWVEHVREPNRGPGHARNAGWRLAADRGADLVCFLDDDAVAPTGWVGAHEDAHRRSERAGIIGGGVRSSRGRNAIADYEDAVVFGAPRTDAGPTRVVPSLGISCTVAALVAVDGFDASLRTHEDVDLCRRLALAGWEVRFDPDPGLVVTHDHPATWRALVQQQRSYGRGFVTSRRRSPDLPGAESLDLPRWREVGGTLPHLARASRDAARAGGLRLVPPAIVATAVFRWSVLRENRRQ